MSTYSQRRILAKQLEIFNRTGQIILLLVNNTVTTPPTYTPGKLFSLPGSPASDIDPVENAANYTSRFIRGRFAETDVEQTNGPGRRRSVKGVITVPMLYKSILAQTEYIDPYLDGSRFIKSGAIVDESRLFATVNIESLSLTSEADVS
jgi:hypothetical protein